MKKTRNPDGTRSLRKNKTMVMPLFRKLVRPIIRGILGRLETPNASQIYSKYYREAIRIVTKRRANHVQSWRLYNRPDNLCYETVKPGQRHRQQQQVEDHQDVEHESQQQDEDESQQQDVEDESQQQDIKDESQQQDVEDESQQQVEDESQAHSDNCGSPTDDLHGRDIFCCLDCKKSFPQKECYFPPDENIWYEFSHFIPL